MPGTPLSRQRRMRAGKSPQRWLHLGSLVWGILIEVLPWTCPLTWAENWLETRAGVAPYQGGFLLHYSRLVLKPLQAVGITSERRGAKS